jgi:hypothetical protein
MDQEKISKVADELLDEYIHCLRFVGGDSSTEEEISCAMLRAEALWLAYSRLSGLLPLPKPPPTPPPCQREEDSGHLYPPFSLKHKLESMYRR